MNRQRVLLVVIAVFAVSMSGLARGEQSHAVITSSLTPDSAMQISPQSTIGVPGFIPFSGVLMGRSGKPIVGSVEITLSIYSEQQGGVPLWSEVQTVRADQRGNYSVALGATLATGVPVGIFATAQARWLGVWPAGEEELPRTLILSVPYALKASDADTLGGKPLSAFVLADSSESASSQTSTGTDVNMALASNTVIAAAAPAAANTNTIKGNGTANFISKFLDPSTIANSVIFESSGGNIGVGTTVPSAKLQVQASNATNGTAISQTGSGNGLLSQTTSGIALQGSSTTGVGIFGSSSATSGSTTVGVWGVVNSLSGAAGVFDNGAGGTGYLLVGQVNGAHRFRVNGNGAVFANSYNDLAGNPIASGDITGVAAGTGLTGGGAAGEVSLGLNTAFTDARYALAAHSHDVSQITNAASVAANTFSGTQTINAGNLDLDLSTATTGNITKNSTRFLHDFGTDNTFLGANAGNLTMGGSVGGNTGMGVQALFSNTTGFWNSASGLNALALNTSGGANTASGAFALQNNTTGNGNTADGRDALVNNTAGHDNVAIGRAAGLNATTGSNNIYLGAAVSGVAGESNTIYLGKQGTQTTAYIAGVRGTTVVDGEPVVIDANGRLGSGAVAPGVNTVGTAQVINESLTASDLAPDSVSTSELTAASVTADKVAFNYATSTVEGGPASDLACIGCVAANEVSFTFASLGANTFTATQTIDAGNLDLDASTGSTGNISKNGTRFLHNFGTDNTFLGTSAGNLTLTGARNTGVGAQALTNHTTGGDNTANGYTALSRNTEGGLNTALGSAGLQSNTTGQNNTAVGAVALQSNVSGGQNTAIGVGALNRNMGDFNLAVGAFAGSNLTTGSNNIYLGPFVQGLAGESNTIYLGRQGQQTRTFIAGIRGIATTNADAVPVVIDSAGQLGTVSSSGFATLGANTFSGTQTAPAFVGDGSALTNLPPGPVGPEGPAGPQGPQGPQGATGPAGTTGQDVLSQTPGFVALAANTHQTLATQPVTTTASNDAVVVAYNILLRNNNAAGTICYVITYALMDGVGGRQTATQLMPGVGSGGQTIAFSPSVVGSHAVTINAYTSCSNVSVDVTGWQGGTYGSTVTTMVMKR